MAADAKPSDAKEARHDRKDKKRDDKHPYFAELEAIRSFCQHCEDEVQRVNRHLSGLSDDDKESLRKGGRPVEEQVSVMRAAVAVNFAFVNKLADVVRAATGSRPREVLDCHPTSSTVQTLLQLFVREWSAEGVGERQECFDKVLGALDKLLGDKPGPKRVLVPGSQLGRLPLEVQARGYETEACEGRPLFYFGTEVLRVSQAKECLKLQAFATNTCNRLKKDDHVRETPIPEIEIGDAALPAVRFGDFLQLYDTPQAKASVDGVVTTYAMDNSSNVLRFVRTVAHVVREGGVWTNFGPLAYDVDHDEAHGHGLELSWEELRHAISHFFDVIQEEFVEALHGQNAESMMHTQYHCVFFAATRNSKPAPGIGVVKKKAAAKAK